MPPKRMNENSASSYVTSYITQIWSLKGRTEFMFLKKKGSYYSLFRFVFVFVSIDCSCLVNPRGLW